MADIEDAIVEPFWLGPRVLASVADGRAELVHDGQTLEAHGEIVTQLVAAVLDDDLVLDGVLTSQALEDGGGAYTGLDAATPSKSSLFGRLLVPGSRRREEMERVKEEEARHARMRQLAFQPDERVALVVTDLLWVDGESLLDVPLLERKRLLESVLSESELIRRSAYIRPNSTGALIGWQALGFSTVAYKSANSRYRPGQANDGWATMVIPARTGAATGRPL